MATFEERLERARKIRGKIDAVAATMNDDQALMFDLFKVWKAGEAVKAGDIRDHTNNLYRCIQAHTTQADWKPDSTPALWTRISIEEWPAWVQPQGAHDAYKVGDKVTHDAKHWISASNANVWAPGVYGWNHVPCHHIREYRYLYGAVSPWTVNCSRWSCRLPIQNA